MKRRGSVAAWRRLYLLMPASRRRAWRELLTWFVAIGMIWGGALAVWLLVRAVIE